VRPAIATDKLYLYSKHAIFITATFWGLYLLVSFNRGGFSPMAVRKRFLWLRYADGIVAIAVILVFVSMFVTPWGVSRDQNGWYYSGKAVRIATGADEGVEALWNELRIWSGWALPAGYLIIKTLIGCFSDTNTRNQ
jgi:hypothetical protein